MSCCPSELLHIHWTITGNKFADLISLTFQTFFFFHLQLSTNFLLSELYNNTVPWRRSEGHESWGIACPFKCALVILISALGDNAWLVIFDATCKAFPVVYQGVGGPILPVTTSKNSPWTELWGDDRLSEITLSPLVHSCRYLLGDPQASPFLRIYNLSSMWWVIPGSPGTPPQEGIKNTPLNTPITSWPSTGLTHQTSSQPSTNIRLSAGICGLNFFRAPHLWHHLAPASSC